MGSKSKYGEFRNCASCKKEINIAVEVFLFRLDKYWHEYCFCCSACSLPIPNCKFLAYHGDIVLHMSCYKGQTNNQEPGDQPKYHLVCELCKELAKKTISLWGILKRNKKKCEHVREVAQSSEEKTSDTPVDNNVIEEKTSDTPVDNNAIEANSASSSNLAGTSTNETNPIPSPASQPQPISPKEPTHSTPSLQQGPENVLPNSPLPHSDIKGKAIASTPDPLQPQGPENVVPNSPTPHSDIKGKAIASTSDPLQPQVLGGDGLVNQSQSTEAATGSSNADNSLGNFDGYLLTCDLAYICEAIRAKYGNITQNCTLGSKSFKSTFLGNICLIVKTLQTTPVGDLNDAQLREMLESVADIEKVGFNVEWLNSHLVKIKKIMDLNEAYRVLNSTREQQSEIADFLKKSIELKEEEIYKLKCQLSEARAKYNKIYHEVVVIKSSLEQCHLNTLVDGLL